MINTFLFDIKEKFDNVEKPFYYIYQKYYKSINNVNNPIDYYKYVLSKNNNRIFYKGIESSVENICKNKQSKISNYINFITNKFKLIMLKIIILLKPN